MKYHFADELIGQLRDTLQLAILSGTDIIDHIRMIEVEPTEDGKLALTADYRELFEKQINSMMQEVEDHQTKMLSEDNESE
jgi:hypothetical protein